MRYAIGIHDDHDVGRIVGQCGASECERMALAAKTFVIAFDDAGTGGAGVRCRCIAAVVGNDEDVAAACLDCSDDGADPARFIMRRDQDGGSRHRAFARAGLGGA